MPLASGRGICSVSRKSVSGSYSTTADRPLTVVANRPCSGSAFVLRLWIFLMTADAVSLRSPFGFRLLISAALYARLGSTPSMRNGLSTVTLQ